MVIEREKDISSAPVNLPQNPNDILNNKNTFFNEFLIKTLYIFYVMKYYLFPDEHGLIMYWHMGRRRNAKAIVAITV